MDTNNTVEACYTVPFSTVALWATDESGNATGDPVWTANCLENVQIRDSFVERRTRPSGSRYANTHHVDETHEITLPSLLDLSFGMVRNTYFVLYIGLLQADKGPIPPEANPLWRDRTYYGVTFMSMSAAGADPNAGNPFHQVQGFRAKFFIPNTGTGTLPGPYQP